MVDYAKFYKCALQVNPYSYPKYRGLDNLNEDEYNESILKKCLENDIKIVGLANHGDCDNSESLRRVLSEKDILVFPGFEITTAEKIHIVCLFDPSTSISELNRILGSIGMPKYENGTEVSNLSCLDIARIVTENNGFWYAAHITSDNGILKSGGLHKVWQSDLLTAAQIPNSRLKIDPKYKNIVNNKEPSYKRSSDIALINAKDICKPEDLDIDESCTYLKMSELSFEAFKQSFTDPTSRVKLKSDMKNCFQSSIDRIQVFGGYLDGLDINFSNELNTIIGGRGTGKSTLINLIRYTLGIYDELTKKEIEEVAKVNLGLDSYVELTITSHKQDGAKFKIRKTYNQSITILDENDDITQFKVDDILPNIEIYGQNELLESVKSDTKITKIVSRLINIDSSYINNRTNDYNKLSNNTKKLLEITNCINELEEKTSDIPSKEEELKRYNSKGLDKKLESITEIDIERTHINDIHEIAANYVCEISKLEIEDNDTLKSEEISEILQELKKFNEKIEGFSNNIKEEKSKLLEAIDRIIKNWKDRVNPIESEVNNLVSEIEGVHNKSSKQIVDDYRRLTTYIVKSKPFTKKIKTLKSQKNKLLNERKQIIEKCKISNDEYAQNVLKSIKKLNKNVFNGVQRLEIHCFQNKNEILNCLKNIDGVGDKGLQHIKEYEDFYILTFVENIRLGPDKIKEIYSLTDYISQKICSLNETELWNLEGLMLGDLTKIELKVGDEFKDMYSLSKGQQCTAILNILLLENKEPLIIDQPEDNLDNAYIAENLVKILRENKFNRQYILATHNANIPVFGDAELIVALEEHNKQGKIIDGAIGSIDRKSVQKVVIDILEGGETALLNRNKKYKLY
ncbi:hypothetical protein E1I18_03450 [Mycoplasmopsis mucosicanis]|uniref:Rad50/SbcC-type AAA domain-containing protein n=1 Tax=Mycoplasmopsis mucosicanis TaxID=458208 RepID=A0A507SQ99_9BACT|nr:AAA family ATPase [Mycoplasmopsis mucosicanis]TQC51273.1 hypothetical protein E1I18_03450 [Mycoplasmopsis mucosicanis]